MSVLLPFHTDQRMKARLQEEAVLAGVTTSAMIGAVLEAWLKKTDAPDIPSEGVLVPDAMAGFSRVPRRPRSEATRQRALNASRGILPWLAPVIDGKEKIVLADLLAAAGDETPEQYPKLLANALHGLGYDEWVEDLGEAGKRRVWLRSDVVRQPSQ